MSAKRKTFADMDSALEPVEPITEKPETVIPPTLGPGDDDPNCKVSGLPAVAGGPLSPGDDDPDAKDRGQASAARGPLAPGEADPNGEQRNFRMLAQPAPGPGDTFTQRRLTVIPNDPKKE